jgi:hypothetical protein
MPAIEIPEKLLLYVKRRAACSLIEPPYGDADAYGGGPSSNYEDGFHNGMTELAREILSYLEKPDDASL